MYYCSSCCILVEQTQKVIKWMIPLNHVWDPRLLQHKPCPFTFRNFHALCHHINSIIVRLFLQLNVVYQNLIQYQRPKCRRQSCKKIRSHGAFNKNCSVTNAECTFFWKQQEAIKLLNGAIEAGIFAMGEMLYHNRDLFFLRGTHIMCAKCMNTRGREGVPRGLESICILQISVRGR